jgi:hypothetical protein
MMEKYGVDQNMVEELVKLGVCISPEQARTVVASGKAKSKIKEAQANSKDAPAATKKEADLSED